MAKQEPNEPNEELTLFSAMEAFDSLTQATVFTPNEVALFYAILSSWNMARRPAVLQQWADTTSIKSGLGRNTLPSARNGLLQKNVIHFFKAGTRGVPHYSLNALFGLPEPDWLLLNNRSKSRVNAEYKQSKRRLNADSYQDKEKEDENGTPKPPGGACVGDPDLLAIISEIQALKPEWSGHLSQPEMVAVYRERDLFRSYPFPLVRDWLASDPEKPPMNRLAFLETGGGSSKNRAEAWAKGRKATDLEDEFWNNEN